MLKSRSPPICSLFGCITQTSCNDFNCKDVLRPFAPVMSIQTQLSWNIAAIWTYPESPVLEIMVLNREKGFEFKTHPMKLNEPLKRLSKLRYYEPTLYAMLLNIVLNNLRIEWLKYDIPHQYFAQKYVNCVYLSECNINLHRSCSISLL